MLRLLLLFVMFLQLAAPAAAGHASIVKGA
jgi:hypothetical protein